MNRDAAFLTLLGVSIDPVEPRWQEATCCNPFATPFPVADDHPAVMHAAAVSVCGLAAKLDDDARDEGPARRFAARVGGCLTISAADRAVGWLNSSSFPTQAVLDRLGSQEDHERNRPESADVPTAEAFGMIVGHLAEVLHLPEQRGPLHGVGSGLGSLVYWRDAWDDRHADLRRGRFNPFEHLDLETIRSRVHSAWHSFSVSLGELGIRRHQELLVNLQETTASRHGSFLELGSGDRVRGKRKKRKSDDQRSCWDSCDCCSCGDCNVCCGRSGGKSGGCCDACCDTGPGDTGCCDCGSCDCCSCN